MRDKQLVEALVAERAPRATQMMAELVTDRELLADERIVLGLLFIVTAGIIPVVIWMLARARRQTLRYYFTHGTLTTAAIEHIDQESGMVHYTYDYGAVRHGMDRIDPAIARDWNAGMLIQVLHIPGGDGLNIVASFR
jgi:hypothetical protein